MPPARTSEQALASAPTPIDDSEWRSSARDGTFGVRAPSGTNAFSSGTVRATRGVLRLTHESTRLAGAAEREQLSARSAVFFVSTKIRFVGGHGRSDAPTQAAKTTLFAAPSEGDRK